MLLWSAQSNPAAGLSEEPGSRAEAPARRHFHNQRRAQYSGGEVLDDRQHRG